jgi:hypothetical protein
VFALGSDHALRMMSTRAAPSGSSKLPSQLKERPRTLEECGITPGSSLLASSEEAKQRDAEERAYLERQNAIIDWAIGSTQHCSICGQSESHTGTDGRRLCPACRQELARQEEADAPISAAERSDLVRAYRRQMQAS